ncbi:LysR family transcriptional regulator [Paenibacillus sp. YIM B09110]|uniref:LysR family transcriptional regulator n=1 Tax=Paenibacillus sp. YIM B09110 TaxID=3126102 RepID=UPI00301CCC84
MNIENIEAFVYVIHCGSFNKAAEALYLSQPSVTARIKSLEQELDCRLFDRQGKQAQVTEDGKRFLPYAQQLLMIYQKGKLHLNQKKSELSELRIGCTVSVSNYIVPELLPRLKERFPETHYKFTTGTTDEIVSKVLSREVDIGFVRNISHPNLQSTKFYEDPIRLYAYEGHPFLHNHNPTIEEVAEQPLVFFECGSMDWLRIHRIFEHLEKSPNIRIHTDNSEMAKKLVIRKTGIGFLPGLCAQQEVCEGKLHSISVPEADGISLQTNLIAQHGEFAEIITEILDIGRSLFEAKPSLSAIS